MNKYQEAYAEIFVDYETMDNVNGLKNINILLELVDRATPKKPSIEILKIKNEEGKVYRVENIYKCGICNTTIKTFNSYMDADFCYKCGQAIDWSETK